MTSKNATKMLTANRMMALSMMEVSLEIDTVEKVYYQEKEPEEKEYYQKQIDEVNVQLRYVRTELKKAAVRWENL